jgi:hypothetical protein
LDIKRAIERGDLPRVLRELERVSKGKFTTNPNPALWLKMAAERKDIAVCNALINSTLLSNAIDSSTKSEALLHLAAASDHSAALKLIEDMKLRKDASLNHQDAMGNTPLMLATHSGNFHVVKALVAAGADVSCRSRNGKTAFDYAIEHNNEAILAALCEKFAPDVSQAEHLLFSAIEKGNDRIRMVVLEKCLKVLPDQKHFFDTLSLVKKLRLNFNPVQNS